MKKLLKIPTTGRGLERRIIVHQDVGPGYNWMHGRRKNHIEKRIIVYQDVRPGCNWTHDQSFKRKSLFAPHFPLFIIQNV
jgi:hypothetical protein